MRRSFIALALCAACAPYPPPPTTPAAATAPGPDTICITIAATTDVHGWLRGWDYFANAPDTTRGLSRMATIVDSLRAANPDRVVLVDAGDLLQGTPITSIALRDSLGANPIIAAMNAMQYDAAAIGNHEFNYGLGYLARAIGQARFPFLAANAFRPDGQLAYPAYTIVERSGVRVALIGGTTPGSMIWDRDKLAGRVEVRDIVAGVREAVQSARAQNAHAVVVVLHSGLGGPSSYDEAATGVPAENVAARVAQEIPGIDLIVFGHSHREVADTTIGTTLLTQPRNWAGSLSVATLSLERRPEALIAAAPVPGGAWRVVSRRARVIRGVGHAEHPGVVAAVQSAHERTISYVTSPIGTTPVAWRSDSARVKDTPIVDFVLEVTRRHANADLASVSAFNLNAEFGPGPITIADMAELYPYENNVLRVIRISGRQLREYLEFSSRYFRQSPPRDSLIDPSVPGFNYDIVAGVDYVLDISRPIGSRVVSLTRRGRPVRDSDSFTLALHDYRQQGGGGYAMIHGAPVVYDRQEQIRQLLIDEIQRRRVLRPEDYFVRNWRIVPDSLVGAAYRSMRQLPYDRPRTTAAPSAALTGPRLRIISTNDLHGYMEPWTDRDGTRRGGLAHVATAIGRARAECQPPQCVSLLVDGGDMMQGPAMSALVYGRPVIQAMNAIGYDAAAVGNHEFDWGEDTLQARMREARFPILAANVRDSAGRDVAWIPNDTLLTIGGRRIGVIGLTDPHTATRTRATRFVFSVNPRRVDSTARALRQRGAEAVIAVTHIGGRCDADTRSNCRGDIIEIARDLAGSVDAIISGDSHWLINTEVNGMPVMQAGHHGRAISVTDIPLGPGASGTPRRELRMILSDSLAEDPAVAAIVRQAADAVAARTAVVITTNSDSLVRRGAEHALGRLIADAQRTIGEADFSLVNNGGIRRELPPGELTYGTLFELQPFGNHLHRVVATGAAIRAYLEQVVSGAATPAHLSGLVVRYDRNRPAGSRIVEMRLADGRPFSDSARYSMVLNEFMVLGGDRFGFAGTVISSERLDLTDIQALVRYLERQPRPLIAPTDRRMIPSGNP